MCYETFGRNVNTYDEFPETRLQKSVIAALNMFKKTALNSLSLSDEIDERSYTSAQSLSESTCCEPILDHILLDDNPVSLTLDETPADCNLCQSKLSYGPLLRINVNEVAGDEDRDICQSFSEDST